MNEYLINILKIENTVIIPGVGALMVTNSKTGAVMFNPHLKFNDKTLEKYVEENSNMDAQESTNFVAKFAQEIQNDLDKGESYEIFGLGKFSKSNDEIEFISSDSVGKSLTKEKTTTPPPPVTPPKKEEEKQVKKEEVKKEKREDKKSVTPINNPFEDKKSDAKNSYVEPSKESKPEKIVEETSKKVEAKKEAKPTQVAPTAKSASTEEKKKALEKAGIKPTKTLEKTKKDKKPKKKRGLLILIIILLLLGGSGAYIVLNWDVYQHRLAFLTKKEVKDPTKEQVVKDDHSEESKDDMTAENVATDSTNNNEENGINSDIDSTNTTETEETPTEVIEEPANEEPVKVVETTTSFESNGSTKGNGDYHVVVGLFSEPSNAEKLVSKLKSSGHNAMILGTFDHLQMVVVKSFPSREDAVSSMREIRSSIEDRAWVFRY